MAMIYASFFSSFLSFFKKKLFFNAVSALNVMFKYLNYPSQLSGWKANGGDPCGDSWEGIGCSGSSVTEMYTFSIYMFHISQGNL